MKTIKAACEVEVLTAYVQELRRKERAVTRRYAKLVAEYMRMKERLKKLDPTWAKAFRDPCDL